MGKIMPIVIVAVSVFAAYTIVSAQPENITFPVAELGGCRNEAECGLYCDAPENISACVDFAEQNGLMDEEEAARARAFVAAGNRGPGGCTGQNECEGYCEDIRHIHECLAFAEEHDLMSPEELEEAKKVAAALASGAALPGGCKNKSECDAYCGAPGNIEECLLFAERAGFLNGEELEEARRVAPLIAAGQTPGGCTRKEKCEAYCSDEANINECAEFAIKAGFMSAEEAEMYRKTGGKGPGDCRGRESCEAYCNDPAHQEQCFNFAKEHGLISEEEMEMMKEGVGRIREGFEMAPDEVRQCFEERLGGDTVVKIASGDFMPSREMGDAIKGCFEEFMPPPGEMPGSEGLRGEGGPGMMSPDGEPPHERENIPPEFQGEIRERIQEETREWIERGRPPTEEEMRGIREQMEREILEQTEVRREEQIREENFPSQREGGGEMMEPRETPQEMMPEPAPASFYENSLFGFVVRALLGR